MDGGEIFSPNAHNPVMPISMMCQRKRGKWGFGVPVNLLTFHSSVPGKASEVATGWARRDATFGLLGTYPVRVRACACDGKKV